MKTYSLKFKLLIFIFGITILLVSAIITNNMIQFDSHLRNTLGQDVIRANEVFKDRIDELKNESTNIGIQLSANPTITKAIEEKNSDQILSDLKMILENSDVDFVTVTDEKGIVLARTHEPEKKR